MEYRFAVLLVLIAVVVTSAKATVPACPGLSGIAAQIDVASANIANAETTRTVEGGPYRRKEIFCETDECEVTEAAEFRTVLYPGHPDADRDGYVRLPKVNVVTEMALMIGLQGAYEQAVRVCNLAKENAG